MTDQYANGARPRLLEMLKVGNRLGEGVIYDERLDCLWWTDISSAVIYRYGLARKSIETWPMPEPVGCLALTGDPQILLLAMASGFARYELGSERLTRLANPERSLPGNRFNDGRVDRQGRFWAGTMVEAPEKNATGQLGSLYRLSASGRAEAVFGDIRISNGLCWSPDSSLMYHADSPTGQITAYDFDPVTGRPSAPRCFVRTPAGVVPDGATVDAEGYLWSAQWGGSRVVRYSPAGDIDILLELPVSQPTCVALGGPHGDLLFVTSARDGLSPQALKNQPNAGNLFIFKVDTKGLIESKAMDPD